MKIIYEYPFAGPGTRLQLQREGIESRTNKISIRLENCRFKIFTWVDKMRIQSCPNDEFQTQFTTFSNAINELTTLALMNRVPIPISRDILDLNDVIIKCKRDRIRNLDPWNDRLALRTKINVTAVIPATDGGFDSSIRRGNVRSMGSTFYNSVDQLYIGGNLQRIPMPMRRSLTILDSIRDMTMNPQGEIIDNVGQRSPRSTPCDDNDVYASRGGIIDNVVQQSPRSTPFGIDDVYMASI